MTVEYRAAEYRFEAIGVPWQIDTPEPLSPAVTGAIHDRIDAFDRTYSRFRPDSLVSRIAETAGTWQFPADAAPLFALYRTLYECTGGSVTPLVGRRLESLGYDRHYSLRRTGETTPVPSWDDAMQWDGERLVTLRPVLVDVGAAGKGYLVDLVAGVLRDHGIDEYLIDASGDLLHRGPAPIRVALEHPHDQTKAIGVYTLANAALCASAPNRRSWGDGLHHILDPLTGEPTTSIVATWAIADSAASADGLATALFFANETALAGSFDFEYARMTASGRVEYSDALKGEMFA